MKKNTEQNERAIDRLKAFAHYARYELKIVKGYSSFEVYCNIGNGYIKGNMIDDTWKYEEQISKIKKILL